MSEFIFLIIIIAFFLVAYGIMLFKCKKELNSLNIGDYIYRYDNIYDDNDNYVRRETEMIIKIDKHKNIIYTDTGEMYTLYDFYRFNITKIV